MGKSTTEQKARSQANKILDTVGREFFQMYCEDNAILKESMDDLLSMARSTDDEKIRLDIRKFLVEQLIGKAKQSTDVTTKGDKLNAGIFIDNGLL